MAKQWGFIRAGQRSQAWLDARQAGIGGSDIAAVMGVSPYKTAWQLHHEKLGLIDPAPVGAAADRGVRLEPVVAQWYADTTGRKLRQSHGIIFLKSHPWAMASLDRTVVGDPSLLCEVKTSASPRWGMWQIPPEVVAQATWQAGIYGAQAVDIACLLGGLVFKVERVDFDQQLFDSMLAAGERFMAGLKSGTPPALDGADAQAFAALTPQATESWVTATPELQRVIDQYREATAEAHFASEKVDALEIILKEAIGENAGLVGDGFSVTWRQARPSEKVNWRAVAAQLQPSAELVRIHTTEQPGSRRFVVKMAGE